MEGMGKPTGTGTAPRDGDELPPPGVNLHRETHEIGAREMQFLLSSASLLL